MYTVSWTLQYPSSDLFSIQPAPWPRLMTFAECGSIIHHQAAGLWEWEARGGGKQCPCHTSCSLLGLVRAQLNWQDTEGEV